MDEPQNPPRQPADPVSRPSSTSAAEAAVSQLLGMTGLGDSNGANGSPQGQRYGPGHLAEDEIAARHGLDSERPADSADDNPDNATAAPSDPHPQSQTTQPAASYNGATPAATAGGNGNTLPICQNCSTSTTPLWRRDEYGSVLCNACGLFLKLHGRPRPISLKTDVIKSRNRVKTMRPDMASKKKTPAPQNNPAARRQSSNANAEGPTDSPISRTGTPSMYNQSLPSFMMDDPYPSANVSNFAANGDGSGSPMNGDTPQTHEQLIAANSSLKTRVRELELINELFRGRLSQLEQQEAAARRGNEVAGVEQTQLRNQLEASRGAEKHLSTQLEDSHRRENSLKRRLDELELELKEAKDAVENMPERPAKKLRVQEPEGPVAAEPETRREKRAGEDREQPNAPKS